MSFYFFIRYFFSKRSGSLIKLVSRLCLAGITISVAALILIVSVMEGFGQAIKSRLLDKQAHLTLSLKQNPFTLQSNQEITKELFIKDTNKELYFLTPEQKKVIQNSQLFETQELILNKDGLLMGISARGYSKEIWNDIKKQSLKNFWYEGGPNQLLQPTLLNEEPLNQAESSAYLLKKPSAKNLEKNILISHDLSLKTELKIGDRIQVLPLGGLLLPPQLPPPIKIFKVAGIFDGKSSSSSFYYQQGNMDFGNFSKTYYKAEIQLKEPDKILEQEKLFKNFELKNWMEQNSYLFFALKLEKFIMILFFSIALIISCLGVSSSLLLLITQKTEDIAILQALGSSKKNLTQIFTNIGLYLSSLALISGSLIGLSIVLFLKYNQFNFLPEMYQDRNIPAVFVPLSYSLILSGTFLLSWLFSYLSSRYFSQLSIVNLLKNKGL